MSVDGILPFKFNQLNTKSQFQNYAEAKYRVFTNLYKKLFIKNTDSTGKYSLLITPCDFMRLVDCLVLSVNTIPYSGHHSLLGPYVCKYPASVVPLFSEDEVMKGDDVTRFGQYLQSLFKLRNEVLLEEMQSRAQHPTHKWHSGLNKYLKRTPKIGDVVLHPFGASPRLCVVIKIIDRSQVMLRQGSKTFAASIANLEIVALDGATM